MKFVAAIVSAIFVVSLARGENDFLGSSVSKFEGKFYGFHISKSALNKAPKWDLSKSEFPPLSPNKAQIIALNQAAHLLPDIKQYLHVSQISLHRLQLGSDWIYFVDIDYLSPSFSSGPPRRITIPVYFDGSTIVPRIRNAN